MRRQVDSRAGGLRHAMDVPARIQTQAGGFIDATIRNASSVGMYLHHTLLDEKRGVDPLPVGSSVTVVFAPDHAGKPTDTVKFSAQVMRRHPHGTGVCFLAVTPDHKRALRMLAVLAVGARESSITGAVNVQDQPAWKQRSRGILSACRKVIERRLPNMIWTLRIEVARQLLLVKDDGNGAAEEARREAAMLEEKGTAIGRSTLR